MERLYYTPTSQEIFGKILPGENLNSLRSASMRKLIGNCFRAITDNDINIFRNGDDPKSPGSRDHKKQAEAAISRVVYQRCQDIFSQDGQVKQEKSPDWQNILQIAPALVSIILDKQSYIEEVAQEHLANTVGLAIDISRNPDILSEVVFNVGFGGSDDEYSSSRLPVYLLPGLKIIQQLKNFYSDREKAFVEKGRREKAFASTCAEEEQKLGRKLTSDERSAINQELKANTDYLPELTEDEIVKLRRNSSIATQFPTLRIFSGAQAAIAINHTMEPNGIKRRTGENMDILQNYVTTNFPGLTNNVEYVQDVSWSNHTMTSKLKLEYFSFILRQSKEPTILRTLETLMKLGEIHGGNNGGKQAADYAAIHPLLFQDRLNLPFSSFLEGVVRNPAINITIGGRSEKHFWAIRRFLQENSGPKGFREFIQQKIKTTPTEEESRRLQKLLSALERWTEKITKLRNQYGNQTSMRPARPDLPYEGVALISSIGKQPTYYYTEFDRPYGTDIRQQVAELELQVGIPEEFKTSIQRQGVIFDLNALIDGTAN